MEFNCPYCDWFQHYNGDQLNDNKEIEWECSKCKHSIIIVGHFDYYIDVKKTEDI